MTAPVMLSCGHCFCWPCYKVVKHLTGSIIIRLIIRTTKINLESLDRFALPADKLMEICDPHTTSLVGFFKLFLQNEPIFAGSTAMNDEELAVYGPRPNGMMQTSQ